MGRLGKLHRRFVPANHPSTHSGKLPERSYYSVLYHKTNVNKIVAASREHLLRRIMVCQLSQTHRKHKFLQAVRLWKQSIRYESASMV
jgi:hypothetical protein